ncbi:MAG: zf-HC2 domain-containing protein [Candidatus Zixiibacteriota bacterium]
MVLSDQQTRCAWVRDRLDPYVDCELPSAEAGAIAAHLSDCAECTAELALAQRTLDALHDLPVLSCPDAVVVEVGRRIGPEPSFWRRLWAGRLLRPALIGAVAVALVAATAIIGRYQSAAPPRLSAEEMAVARAEVKWALAIVSDVARRTEKTVRRELPDPRLLAPVRRTIEKKESNRDSQSRLQLEEEHYES